VQGVLRGFWFGGAAARRGDGREGGRRHGWCGQRQGHAGRRAVAALGGVASWAGQGMCGVAVKGSARKYFMDNWRMNGLGAGEAGALPFPEV
jgi:hypothetical protein